MRIALTWDGPSRVWHTRLAERLAAMGHAFELHRAARTTAPRLDVHLLLAAERVVYGATPALFAQAPAPVTNGVPANLTLELLFDGTPGEAALIDAILSRRVPEVTVQGFDEGRWRDLAVGLPANEEPFVFARGIEHVLARVVALVVQAARPHDPAAVEDVTAPKSGAIVRKRSSAAGFFARGLMDKLVGRLTRRGEHWSIALRTGPGDLVAIPDDGLRFQADPFLLEHDGRLQLFFEDFPYATRKGVIARVEIDMAGRSSPPRTVLEQPVHLSYPFVLAHAGAIYMLPEMGEGRRIQLFRADPFPDRWTPDAVLVDDIVAGDATPVFHDGLWWMFATLASDGGSSWDQLGLFFAPDLLGPWSAHACNPVLIDAGAARPAGAMWHEAGVLMRVVQDCRAGYGAALAICRVDRLDHEGFSQTVIERIGPPVGSSATGLHTRSRAGQVEAIDLKWRRGHRQRFVGGARRQKPTLR